MKIRWLIASKWETVQGHSLGGEPMIGNVYREALQVDDVKYVQRHDKFPTSNICLTDGTTFFGVPNKVFEVLT